MKRESSFHNNHIRPFTCFKLLTRIQIFDIFTLRLNKIVKGIRLVIINVTV